MIVQLSLLNAFLQLDEEFKNFFCIEDEEDGPADIAMAFDQCTPKLIEHHKSLGFYFEGENLICDPEKFAEIISTSNHIIDDYESSRLPSVFGSNTWEQFELGGDDDVDYCGGYVIAGIEALRRYLKSLC